MSSEDRHAGLRKAYSSKLRIELQNGKEYIIKQVDAQEAESELFFQNQLKTIGLSAMEMVRHDEGLAVLFISDAQTLGDNETPELYEKLGAELRRLHEVTFAEPFVIDAAGERQEISWIDFIHSRLDFATARQAKDDGLNQGIIKECKKKILEVISKQTEFPCLIHGDLHANNVLIKDSNLYIFDKASQIMTGDPMYDLALFGITLPGAVYKVGNDIARDKLLMVAFIKGYGTDFTRNRDIFDAYVLLRCLERWPNPFEKEIPEIVKCFY